MKQIQISGNSDGSRKIFKIYDDLLSEKERQKIYDNLELRNINVKEYDRSDTPSVGTSMDLFAGDLVYDKLLKFIRTFDEILDNKVCRVYVNKFSPDEKPYWHNDGDVITVLYYPNMEFDLDNLGETQFLEDNKTITAVFPVPGRFVVFDGRILHRATTFRKGYRYTVAYKLNRIGNQS